MSEIEVLLTVPHAKCLPVFDPDTKHLCDFAAPRWATAIRGELVKLNVNVTIFMGNTPRTETDLNRIQSTYTEFHDRIRKWIKETDRRERYIIDCHSYPRGKIFDDKEFVVMLNDTTDQKCIDFQDTIARLYKSLGGGIMRHTGVNYIINSAIDENIPAVLLEMSQEYPKAKVWELAAKIAQTIVNPESVDKSINPDANLKTVQNSLANFDVVPWIGNMNVKFNLMQSGLMLLTYTILLISILIIIYNIAHWNDIYLPILYPMQN